MLFTPASTRAALAQAGVKTIYRIGDSETYSLGPDELPGEIELRAECLEWLGNNLSLILRELPENKRKEEVRDYYRHLVDDLGLHTREAIVVLECAMSEAKAEMPCRDGEPCALETAKRVDDIRKLLLDWRVRVMVREHATRLSEQD